jgi:hypothetical protein
MSVWPQLTPASALLSSNEGELLLVSIAVEPRRLESLLEILAGLNFPVNPQIYHETFPTGASGRRAEAETLVEFPAYEMHLGEIRQAFSKAGFDPRSVRAAGMLEEIHAGLPGVKHPKA